MQSYYIWHKANVVGGKVYNTVRGNPANETPFDAWAMDNEDFFSPFIHFIYLTF